MKDDPGKNGKNPPFSVRSDDAHLWDFVTRNIKPLLNPTKKAPKPAETRPARTKMEVLGAVQPDYAPAFTLKSPPVHQKSDSAAGIDRNTAERLRKGKMPIEGVLDLHGLRQGEAHEQLIRFISNAHSAGRRCVLVITGKGARHAEGEAGVLRRMVPYWLGLSPLSEKILLHTPAQPKDGGSGALYILLRRVR